MGAPIIMHKRSTHANLRLAIMYDCVELGAMEYWNRKFEIEIFVSGGGELVLIGVVFIKVEVGSVDKAPSMGDLLVVGSN